MARTTINIDDPVLRDVKALQEKDGRAIGKIVSELLVEALTLRKAPRKNTKLKWISRPMGSRVDLADKDALYAILDAPET